MYRYNGLGQRIHKARGNAAWTYYVYDDQGRLLAELDRDNRVLKLYVWLDQTLLAVVRHDTNENETRDPYETAETFYVHTDHLGTPQRLTDENRATVWSAAYDPFGAATVNQDPDNDGNAVVMNMRFPGQYFDGETGLHYNYYRYYDPATGRYLRSDPIGLDGGLNTYGYVGGNPVRYVDLYGLITAKESRELYEKAINELEEINDPNGELTRCVIKCIAKRELICIPFRAGGMVGGTAAGMGLSIIAGGTTFAILPRAGAAVGGYIGRFVCGITMFDETCFEECQNERRCH